MIRSGASAAIVAMLAFLASPLGAQRPSWPAWTKFESWTDLDEGYRAEFGRCDASDVFRGHPLNRKIGVRYFYGCSADPSHVTMLRHSVSLPGLPNGAVAFTSKLAVDLDGSWYACNTPGRTDQCPTSLSIRGKHGRMEPVSSDDVPYIAIPVSGPTRRTSGEFARLTGVGQGDFGVIVTATDVIPVIVADGGPFSKLGEGSIALHRRLGRELCAEKDAGNRCVLVSRPLRSIAGPLITIIEPGSRRRDLTSENVIAVTRAEGERIWRYVRSSIGR